MNVLYYACLLAALVEATPIPRDLKPDFTNFRFLMGQWTCMVDSARRPRPFKQVLSTSVSGDGYWMVTKTITEPVPWNPITITAMDYLTYDPTTTRWIDITMDDYGLYDLSASPGWNGNAVVWTEIAYPQLHGAKINHARTFTKINDGKTVLDTSFDEASGKHVGVVTTCEKS